MFNVEFNAKITGNNVFVTLTARRRMSQINAYIQDLSTAPNGYILNGTVFFLKDSDVEQFICYYDKDEEMSILDLNY